MSYEIAHKSHAVFGLIIRTLASTSNTHKIEISLSSSVPNKQSDKFWTNCLVCGAQTVNSHRIPDFTIALRQQIDSADIRADRNHLRNTLQQILNNKPEYICLSRISDLSLRNTYVLQSGFITH